MPFFRRIVVPTLVLCAWVSPAFGLMDRVNVLGYGGVSQIGHFSDDTADALYGTLVGLNAGVMGLLALTNGPLAPVAGVGAQYILSLGDTTAADGITHNRSKLTALSGTGHLGLRLSIPFVQMFVIGNGGVGLSGTMQTDQEVAGLETATTTNHLTQHTFFGGTAALTVSMLPFVKCGVGATYNVHNATFENQVNSQSQAYAFQEASAHVVLNVSL